MVACTARCTVACGCGCGRRCARVWVRVRACGCVRALSVWLHRQQPTNRRADGHHGAAHVAPIGNRSSLLLQILQSGSRPHTTPAGWASGPRARVLSWRVRHRRGQRWSPPPHRPPHPPAATRISSSITSFITTSMARVAARGGAGRGKKNGRAPRRMHAPVADLAMKRSNAMKAHMNAGDKTTLRFKRNPNGWRWHVARCT